MYILNQEISKETLIIEEFDYTNIQLKLFFGKFIGFIRDLRVWNHVLPVDSLSRMDRAANGGIVTVLIHCHALRGPPTAALSPNGIMFFLLIHCHALTGPPTAALSLY